MDPWLIAITVYSIFAITTAIPTIYAIIKGVKPHDGGDSFENSPNFSEEAKIKLAQHSTGWQTH